MTVRRLWGQAFADEPFRVLGDNTEHATDLAFVIRQRAVGEGVVGFLRVAAALEKQPEAFVPGRLAGPHDR